jgi:hypothetical protein
MTGMKKLASVVLFMCVTLVACSNQGLYSKETGSDRIESNALYVASALNQQNSFGIPNESKPWNPVITFEKLFADPLARDEQIRGSVLAHADSRVGPVCNQYGYKAGRSYAVTREQVTANTFKVTSIEGFTCFNVAKKL